MIGDSSSNFSNHDLDFDFSQTFQKSRRITSNKYIPEAVFMAYMEYLILYKDSNFPQSILLSKIPKVDIKTIIETKNSKALQDCILNPKFQASISSITNHDKFEDLRSKLTRISQELNIQIVKISSSGLVIYGSSSFKVYILNDECENYIFYPKP